jgi:hypothetical protein
MVNNAAPPGIRESASRRYINPILRSPPVKKTLISLLIVGLLVLITALPALAGGDQERGDKAQGAANQVQAQDPPPFQP